MRENDDRTTELNGQDFAERYLQHLGYHRRRILAGFGTDEPLPPIQAGSIDDELLQAERRFTKASELLYREDPLPEVELGAPIDTNSLNRMTDNLAWSALELMLVSTHLSVLKRLRQRTAMKQSVRITNGRRFDIKDEEQKIADRIKALTPTAIRQNHQLRDFFSGGLAINPNFKLSSPRVLENCLRKAVVIEDPADIAGEVSRGISLEIAATNYLAFLAQEDPDISRSQPFVMPGDEEQDLIAGDAIFLRGQEPLFFDFKNHRPPGQYTADELEKGRKLRYVGDHWRAIVWGESMLPVSEDRFRLSDPALRGRLRGVIMETEPALANSSVL